MTQSVTQVEAKPKVVGKVLLVEDTFLVGMMLAERVRSFGYECVGPVASLREGLDLARRESFSGAILDVNIKGGTSDLIARELESRGCPFFFVTGYASPLLLSESLKARPRLSKPISDRILRETMQAHFGGGGG